MIKECVSLDLCEINRQTKSEAAKHPGRHCAAAVLDGESRHRLTSPTNQWITFGHQITTAAAAKTLKPNLACMAQAGDKQAAVSAASILQQPESCDRRPTSYCSNTCSEC